MLKQKQSPVAGRKDKQNRVFDDRPCFFKTFLHQIMAQQLYFQVQHQTLDYLSYLLFHVWRQKIPSHFVKHILERVTASIAILTGPSGGRWCVEIWKTSDDVFLGDGWQGFVRDNLLRELDFLLFKYDGDMRFTVQIFDRSGLERGTCQLEDATPGRTNQQRPAVYPVKFTNPQKKLPSECRSGKRTGDGARREAKPFSSQFPFFERLMKDYNVQRAYMVNIPKPFTDVYFLKEKSKVILRSLEGKAWEVNCRVYAGKFAFAAGWRSFVDDNKLKVGDVCIFELVGEMELQVHIFNK